MAARPDPQPQGGAAGQSGALWVGHKRAASLGAWSLTLSAKAGETRAWVLRAAVTGLDAYWASQGPPFRVVLAAPGGEWRWDGVTVAPSPDGITVALTAAPVITRLAQARP